MIFEICKRAYAINLYWLKAIMYASPNLMWMLANFIVTSQIPTQCIYLYILINMNLRLMQQQQFVAYINKYNKFLVFQWIVTSFLFSSTKSYCNLLHPTYYKYIYIINANNWSVLGDWIRLNCKKQKKKNLSYIHIVRCFFRCLFIWSASPVRDGKMRPQGRQRKIVLLLWRLI